MKQKKISKRTWKNKEFIFVRKITQTRNHLLNLILVNLPVSVTTSVSTLTSTLGWASHLLLSLSFLKAEVVVFFSSVMLLSFLFLRVTNQVPALSEVKIEGNRNNLGANLKDKKNQQKSGFSDIIEFLTVPVPWKDSFSWKLQGDLFCLWMTWQAIDPNPKHQKWKLASSLLESEKEMLKFKV